MNVQYAAGLIDGEGYIGISRTKAQTYNIRVAVAMVTKGTPILARMHSAFGGHVSEMKPESDRNAAKTRWTVDGEQAASFLEAVKPHLILKTGQAAEALSVWDLIVRSRAVSGRKHWNEKLRARCEVSRLRIREMNARGPSAAPPTLPSGRPVAIYRHGWWWEPEDDLFGPVEFEGKWPTCGRMVSGHVYATPTWLDRSGDSPSSSPRLPTPTSRDWKDGGPVENVPENALLGRVVWRLAPD